MRIVSIVGSKNTGKTSLTVKIIEELSNRGFKVASIKHSHHEMEIDHINTDTYKHKEAGSDFVVGVGKRTFFNINQDMSLEKLLFFVSKIDLYFALSILLSALNFSSISCQDTSLSSFKIFQGLIPKINNSLFYMYNGIFFENFNKKREVLIFVKVNLAKISKF